jgi:Fe-S-cluster-containing hydrogenase component 2
MSATPKPIDMAAVNRAAAAGPHDGENRVLMVTPAKCTGCRTCELACAMAHGQQMLPARSRVRAYSFAEDRNVPILCLQCEQAACEAVCPVDAIVRNEATASLEVRTDACVMCMACVPACPFGNIYEDQAYGRIVKCDVCGGNPICARFCPTGALSYEGC